MFIVNFMYYFKNFSSNPNGIMVNEPSYQKLCELYDYIEKHFQSCGELYELFIKVIRGSFYDNYTAEEIEDMQYWLDSPEDDFYAAYPDEESICQITIKKYDNGWFILAVDDDKIIEINAETNDWGHDLCPLIDYLMEQAKTVHNLQMNNSYETEVIQKIKLNQRFGIVKAKYVYALHPQIKENISNGITDDEVKHFKQIMENPMQPMPHMNLSMYLNACNTGYLANKEHHSQYNRAKTDKTPMENYRRIADGRDDGLLDLDLQSYEAFDQWLSDSKNIGGHPFEVVTSMDIMNSIHLYPYKDENGYVFMISCRRWSRGSEIIRFALAIHDLGYPVVVHDYKHILKRLDGETMIGIAPNHIKAYRADAWFRDINDYDFAINYDILIQDKSQEDIDVLFSHVTWFDIKYSEIKKDSN